VDIPVASVDELLCAVYPAMCEPLQAARAGSSAAGSAAAAALPPPPFILVAKLDARGREGAVLQGMAGLLGSASLRPRNLIIEVNKRHMTAAAALLSQGSGSAAALEAALVAGSPGTEALELSEADNEAAAAKLVALVQQLLGYGYEVLVADRGWWAASDPWRDFNRDPSKPLSDGTTLKDWAAKLSQRGEVDIWAYRSE
jgi:hypothetical protein